MSNKLFIGILKLKLAAGWLHRSSVDWKSHQSISARLEAINGFWFPLKRLITYPVVIGSRCYASDEFKLMDISSFLRASPSTSSLSRMEGRWRLLSPWSSARWAECFLTRTSLYNTHFRSTWARWYWEVPRQRTVIWWMSRQKKKPEWNCLLGELEVINFCYGL